MSGLLNKVKDKVTSGGSGGGSGGGGIGGAGEKYVNDATHKGKYTNPLDRSCSEER